MVRVVPTLDYVVVRKVSADRRRQQQDSRSEWQRLITLLQERSHSQLRHAGRVSDPAIFGECGGVLPQTSFAPSTLVPLSGIDHQALLLCCVTRVIHDRF